MLSLHSEPHWEGWGASHILASHCTSVAGAASRLPAACISLSPYRSLCCSSPSHFKPFSRPAKHPHSRRCHSHHSAAPTAALHSPPQHQVVLHMYQPTVLNSLVLETLPMAALNNLPSQHLSRLWQTFAIGWSSFLKQNGARILYAVFATPCAS